ncbi:type I-E CRISPR-associated protein Cse1/CasA [Nocardiopsis dassonvillei]
MRFDLTTRPWIPVLLLDGTEEELSLRGVFDRAKEIRRLSCGKATAEAALLRVLLAIVHDALDGPADDGEWAQLWSRGWDVSVLHVYLDTHVDRFNLLHPSAPFMQVAGLDSGSGAAPVERIVPEVPNNVRFFTMREGKVRLSFAEAARYLIEAHAYDASGIKSAADGDPRGKGGKVYPLGTGWAGKLGLSVVHGANLHQTLVLNLVPGCLAGDVPVWRRPPLEAGPMQGAEEHAVGPRSLYTWPSRRIRLVYDDERVHGVILCYGDALDAIDRHDQEPMSSWRRSQAAERALKRSPVLRPHRPAPEVVVWRTLASWTGADAGTMASGVAAHLGRQVEAGRLAAEHPVRLEGVRVLYGTQESVFSDIASDSQVLPVGLTASAWTFAHVQSQDDVVAAVMALGSLAVDLARAEGMVDPEVRRIPVEQHAWAMLDGPCRAYLAGTDPVAPAMAWLQGWDRVVREVIAREGETMVEQASDKAQEGRTITEGDKKIWFNSDKAGLRFREALRTAVPSVAEPGPDGRGLSRFALCPFCPREVRVTSKDLLRRHLDEVRSRCSGSRKSVKGWEEHALGDRVVLFREQDRVLSST